LKHRFIGRFYYPIGAGFVLKLNMEAGHVTSPRTKVCPSSLASLLAGILDVRGFRFRTVGPRVGLTQSTDPNSSPISNGANIGGNLEYFQNSSSNFRSSNRSVSAGCSSPTPATPGTSRANYCKAGGVAIQYAVVSPCFNGVSSLALLRTSTASAFAGSPRWARFASNGVSPSARSRTKRVQRVRIHHRQLLLSCSAWTGAIRAWSLWLQY